MRNNTLLISLIILSLNAFAQKENDTLIFSGIY